MKNHHFPLFFLWFLGIRWNQVHHKGAKAVVSTRPRCARRERREDGAASASALAAKACRGTGMPGKATTKMMEMVQEWYN